MTILSLLASAFTFTATATGLEKGAPVEFFLTGNGSDRDYESLFMLDGSVTDFCKRLEAAGMPRGKPEDVRSCVLWPVGCQVEMKPSIDDFLDIRLPAGLKMAPIVYTGGKRLPDGDCEAGTNMPLSVFSLYSLGQSPLVFATHFDQSAVYNCFLAKKKIAKGTRVEFTVSWDTATKPTPLSLVIRPGKAAETIREIKDASSKGEVDVLVDFDGGLSVAEAKKVAQALSVIDSSRVKINGCSEGHLFYRAFLPTVKWLDRKERLVQPFELTVGATNRLVCIESDWKVEGLDPRLIPHDIPFAEAKRHKDVDTCFLYVQPQTPLSRIYDAMKLLKDSSVRTWYVFDRP